MNAAHQIEIGGIIQWVDINLNGNLKYKNKQSEVGLVIIYNNKNWFLLTYMIPSMDGETLHKDLVTLEDKTQQI